MTWFLEFTPGYTKICLLRERSQTVYEDNWIRPELWGNSKCCGPTQPMGWTRLFSTYSFPESPSQPDIAHGLPEIQENEKRKKGELICRIWLTLYSCMTHSLLFSRRKLILTRYIVLHGCRWLVCFKMHVMQTFCVLPFFFLNTYDSEGLYSCSTCYVLSHCIYCIIL